MTKFKWTKFAGSYCILGDKGHENEIVNVTKSDNTEQRVLLRKSVSMRNNKSIYWYVIPTEVDILCKKNGHYYENMICCKCGMLDIT